jgi:hypothetical protein
VAAEARVWENGMGELFPSGHKLGLLGEAEMVLRSKTEMNKSLIGGFTQRKQILKGLVT